MQFASLLPSSSTGRTNIEVAVIALIGGTLGYFIKYYLDRLQAYSTENAKIKRNMYEKYLAALRETTKQLIEHKDSSEEAAEILKAFGTDADKFYTTSILYGSPKVVRRYADFVRHSEEVQSDSEQYELLLKSSRLYKAMRKDIGLSNLRLGIDGELLLRANLDNYDTTVRQYTRWSNRMARWLKVKR